MKRFICTLFGLLAGMALLLPSLSWAKYPEKPITFICPYGAGGSTDIQARVLAGSLDVYKRQPLGFEDNKRFAKRRPADAELLRDQVEIDEFAGFELLFPDLRPQIVVYYIA